MLALDIAPIRTARLTLRPLTAADVGPLFAIHSDATAMRYWSAPVWDNDERGRAMVCADLDPDLNDYLRLGIEQTGSGTLLGTCTFFDLNRQCRRAELGYMLASHAWGHGYMREALTAFLNFGFGHLHLNRIEADTDTRNARSMQLLERLHFLKEGHFRERWIVDGEVSDSAMYGLLRRDWPPSAHIGEA
jgi:[ribosomal protein S5]-alanine N-acetyltransferase